jgi:UDP-3-O-[3-hydroxymyristoyl] N-acetylglucosamine deacetylase
MMDGLPQNLILDPMVDPSLSKQRRVAARQVHAIPTTQRTVKASIDCVGIGLHSGRRVSLAIHPAPPGHGIVFRRSDLDRLIPARYDHVIDTRLCTVLGDPADQAVRVSTVEHVMAALAGQGIDNALIEVDGPEVPIFDGSAGPLLFLLDCAGIDDQALPRASIEILRPIRVTEGAAFAELRPATPGHPGLEMTVSIDFAASAIGRQAYSVHLSPSGFRHELANARTFALANEVEQLRAMGLAQGGSLDNALVVDGNTVLNPGGLRMPDEFVRHKILDAVGDLALAGGPIHGLFIAHRTGHALNNRLMHAVFSDPSAWRLANGPALAAA